MTKILSLVSHKNYNFGANEGFVMFLTSKLFTCFIDSFTSKRKSQSIAYLLIGSEYTYIGFWTLIMKCTQYGLYEQAAFKNARFRPRSGVWAKARVGGPRLWRF